MRIDVLTSAIPRPLLADSVGSFLDAFADRADYHVRWVFHLDQYPGMEDGQQETFDAAARLAGLFDDCVLMRSSGNVGFVESVRRMLRVSESPVVFAEDDWLWTGKFWLGKVESEVARHRKQGYNFRNSAEYIGAMGCSYWRREPVDKLLRWWKYVTEEREAKRVLRHSGFQNLISSRRPLQNRRILCRHLGPGWGAENNYAGRID